MIPRLAALEMPATIAIGAARISGQGVATTSTARARTASPLIAHARTATTSVTGTKINAYRSASRTNGARSRCACSTSRRMPAYVLRSALATARRSNAGPAFTAPERTCSAATRSTGLDSPVSADSSKTPLPDAKKPSTGTTSPCLTSKRSPGRTSPIGTDERELPT
jgi:hypothetical protein